MKNQPALFIESNLALFEKSPEQEALESRQLPTIESTYRARVRSTGEIVEVNVFDYNLAFAAGAFEKHIQLSDGAWIRLNALELIS